MKIVISNPMVGNDCYIQVKDFLTLGRVYGDKKMMNHYVAMLNQGHGDYDFVRITNMDFVNQIIASDVIINFMDFKDEPFSYLSQFLIQLNSFFGDASEKDIASSKSDDLRDIMAFQKGDLSYPIPAILDGRLQYVDEELGLICGSTILKDCYVLKSVDGRAVNTIDYDAFFKKAIDQIYENDYPAVKIEDRKYKYYDRGSSFFLFLHQKLEKKQGKLGKLLAKIKKVNEN